MSIENCEEGVAISDVGIVDGGVFHAFPPTCLEACLPCISAEMNANPFPVPSAKCLSLLGSDRYTPICQ